MDNELSSSPSTEEGVYRIPKKQFYGLVITLISTLIGTIGTVSIAYYNRPDTADRWYGWQGRANKSALAENRTAIRKLNSDVDELSRIVQSLDSSRDVCNGRIAKLEARWELADDKMDGHISWARQVVQDIAVKDARIEVRLDECLKRTGLKN